MRRAERVYRANFGIAVAGVALLLSAAASRAALVNFNTGPSDVTNNFNVNFDGAPVPTAPGAGSNFNWNATAGVSDNGGNPGGGISTTNQDATAVYLANNGGPTGTAWVLSGGATVSAFFKGSALGTDRIYQVAFSNKANSSLNNDGTNGAVNAAQQATSHATGFISVRPYGNGRIEQQLKNANVDATINSDLRAAGTALLNNEWYKLSIIVTETTPGNFTALSTLDDYGTAGTSLVSNNFTQATPSVFTLTGFDDAGNNAGVGNGFAAVRQVTDAPSIDNFGVTGTSVQVAVPEPASLGLFALAGVSLTARRCRRRA